jgi:hypothetical protein
VTATDDGTGTLSSSPQTVTMAVTPNLLQLSAEVVTLGSLFNEVFDETTNTETDKYIKISVNLNMDGLPSDFAGEGLLSAGGNLVIDVADYLIVDPDLRGAQSSSTGAQGVPDSNLGAGYRTETESVLVVNDKFDSSGLGNFTIGGSANMVENTGDRGTSDSLDVAYIYLNVDEDNVSSVDIGISGGYSTSEDTGLSVQYDQVDYTISVDIV